MGRRWSITARNTNDLGWIVCDYNLNLIQFILKGIYCLFKFEIVDLGKHG